jgi:hypothetical protein
VFIQIFGYQYNNCFSIYSMDLGPYSFVTKYWANNLNLYHSAPSSIRVASKSLNFHYLFCHSLWHAPNLAKCHLKKDCNSNLVQSPNLFRNGPVVRNWFIQVLICLLITNVTLFCSASLVFGIVHPSKPQTPPPPLHPPCTNTHIKSS